MIFFRGWGFLVPLYVVPAFATAILLGTRDPTLPFESAMAAGFIVAAILCWWSGKSFNNPAKDRTTIDPKTGDSVTRRQRSTFMFVPVQYWALPYGLAAMLVFKAAP